MKDFNFFSPYLLEKRNKQLRKRFLFGVASLIIIGILSFTALNFYQISRYKSEISKVEAYLNSKETIDRLNQYEEVSQKLKLLNTYFNLVNEVDRKLDSRDTVNTDLLDKLASAMPQSATMQNLMVSSKEVEMSFSSNSLVQIAELEHNLKDLNLFEKVHVNIIESNINYTAIISCRLKDVSISEAKNNP